MSSTAEDLEDHTIATLELVSLTSIRGILVGIAFTLYCMCVQLWYKDRRNNQGFPKRTLALLLYSSLIMVFTLVSFGTDTYLVVSAFLDHPGYFRAPSMHGIQLPATGSPNLEVLHVISSPIIVTLTSAMQVFLFWNHSSIMQKRWLIHA